MKRNALSGIICLIALLGSARCSSGDSGNATQPSSNTTAKSGTTSGRDLPDRATVLGLVRNERVIEIRMSLPNSTEAHQFDREYQKLMDEGIVKCRYAESLADGTPFYSDCAPGPSGGVLDSGLSMTIGYKKPSEVTGIVKTSENSAVADLTLTFEGDPDNGLYRTHRDILNRIGQIMNSNNLGSQFGKAFLTLYDDGWRVQRTCAVGQMSCY